jgi:hypothetical protein
MDGASQNFSQRLTSNLHSVMPTLAKNARVGHPQLW